MPPTPASTPKSKGKAAFLFKKVGPFSAWVWLVMLGGSVAIWYMLRRSRGGGSPVDLVTGADAGSTPPDAASSGAPAENAAPGTQLDPQVLSTLQGLGDQLGAFQTQQGQQLDELRYALEDSLYSQSYDYGGGYSTDQNVDATVASTLGSPGAVPAKTQRNPVLWGGKKYGAGQGAALARDLRSKGADPGAWAFLHPTAAQYLGIKATDTKKPGLPKGSPVYHPAPKKKPAPVKSKAVVHKAKLPPPPKKPAPRKVAVKHPAPKKKARR